RAKDKSFNVDFKADLDESLPKINIITQDIGRVLLNLINNAFYAVSKKTNGENKDYKPEVIVSSKLISPSGGPASPVGGGQGEVIQVSVKDNGPGIPKEIKDKIFQPFFTTKPTGSGTGLGLSLSYDIVKAHGGDLSINSELEIGAEFILKIPLAS
ncbi:MAG: HAMP domain-containing histidine kinase, partial [Cyclobacteriaceae bacterium]|nr:HAMP domain-containing histidine kinase [Cyclobacteriaceae bacterium]